MRHQNYYFYRTLYQNYTCYVFILFIGTIIIKYFLFKMWEHTFLLCWNSVQTWHRRLLRWMGRGEECIWFYGEFVVYFTVSTKNLSFTKVYFLNFCKNFFLVRVSGREGFCSQSNKEMSQIKKRLTEIVETEENFHFFWTIEWVESHKKMGFTLSLENKF